MTNSNNKKRINPTKLLRLTIKFVIIIALIHALHAVFIDTVIEYVEVSLHSENLPPEMHGYRIALVTDTHDITADRIEAVVAEINARQVDLLLLGGDHVPTRGFTADFNPLEVLSRTETTDGIFGVEGNHDRRADIFAIMEQFGIVPLVNSGVYVREGFYLAGVGASRQNFPDIAAAVSDAGSDSFILLLAHNPDVSMEQNTIGIDLILSGHTHGGQITFFGVFAPALAINYVTQYGHRFMSGWARSRDGVPVYTSRGTGEYLPRVFARPQVIIITLYHEGANMN